VNNDALATGSTRGTGNTRGADSTESTASTDSTDITRGMTTGARHSRGAAAVTGARAVEAHRSQDLVRFTSPFPQARPSPVGSSLSGSSLPLTFSRPYSFAASQSQRAFVFVFTVAGKTVGTQTLAEP
jgi:hypothetical protein